MNNIILLLSVLSGLFLLVFYRQRIIRGYNPLPREHHLELWRQWEIRTADGKVRRLRKKKCDSYVLAMVNILAEQMHSGVSLSTPDTGNTSRVITRAAANFSCEVSAANSDYGLVVGTGTNAVALADYALQTKIATGTGAGQLQYGAVSYSNPVTSGTTRKFTLIRSFTNNSGASITVNETGIYCDAATWYFCIVRDLESPGVAIADGAVATLTYTIGVTV